MNIKKLTLRMIGLVTLLVYVGGPSAPVFAQLAEPSVMSLDEDSAAQGAEAAGLTISDGATARGKDGYVSVIVQLEDPSLATYHVQRVGLSAAGREDTRAFRETLKSVAGEAYLTYLNEKMDRFESEAKALIPSARVVHRYQAVLGGVSMMVPEDQMDRLAGVPGVKAVYPDRLLHPLTNRSPYFVQANTLWSKLGGSESAGEGVVVGVLDTGIWPEHPSFSNPDPSGKSYPAPPADWKGYCEAPHDGSAPLPCNNKLIGAREFLSTYKATIGLAPGEFDSARDSDGHGTHVASTAAGNYGVAASIFGISRGLVSGMAPRAHVAMYRVCGQEGCESSDSISAVQQAVLDGVDVINFSISGGTFPYGDAVELAFLDAYAAGVFVAAAAGNDGPASNTVSHRGGWMATVAASTNDRFFQSDLSITAGNGDTLGLSGGSITRAIGTPKGVALAKDFGDELCLNPFPPNTFTGKIVACTRGTNARILKGYNVKAGGAAGMILCNPSLQGTFADNHFLPTVHLEIDAVTALVDFLGAHTGETAMLSQGKRTPGRGDIMASFSSRGGTGQALGISKPDMSAPGVQILAGQTPKPDNPELGPKGQLFQCIQGTSMSSPHVAGAAALLKAWHPGWTPGRIKSALMTSATTSTMFKEDGTTPADSFDMGSGRINLKNASNVPLTFDAKASDYRTYESSLWKVNYPSIYVPRLATTLTVRRTAHNHRTVSATWTLTVNTPPDLKITFPAKITIPAGGDVPFDILIDATGAPLGVTRYAKLTMSNGTLVQSLPITIVHR